MNPDQRAAVHVQRLLALLVALLDGSDDHDDTRERPGALLDALLDEPREVLDAALYTLASLCATFIGSAHGVRHDIYDPVAIVRAQQYLDEVVCAFASRATEP